MSPLNGVIHNLVSGYALFSHGYHRATEDIDLLVPNSSASSKAIIDSLKWCLQTRNPQILSQHGLMKAKI